MKPEDVTLALANLFRSLDNMPSARVAAVIACLWKGDIQVCWIDTDGHFVFRCSVEGCRHDNPEHPAYTSLEDKEYAGCN